MKTSALAHLSVDTDFLIRSAVERIRQLEEEVRRLYRQPADAEKYIRIVHAQNIIKVSVRDILCMRGESNYSRIFLKDGNQYFTSRTLKSWTMEIADAHFLRCHKSFVVNRQAIVSFDRITNHLVMQGGMKIPVSRSCRKQCLLQLFQAEGKRPIPAGRKLRYAVRKPPLKANVACI